MGGRVKCTTVTYPSIHSNPMMSHIYLLIYTDARAWDGTDQTMLAVYTEVPTTEQLTEHLLSGLGQIYNMSCFKLEEIVLELLTSPKSECILNSGETFTESVVLQKTPINTVLNV